MDRILKAAACIVLAASTAACVTSYSINPMASSESDVRYDRGRPTTTSEREHSAVRLTPLGVAPGNRLTFGVAAFNRTERPANFGTENVTMSGGDGKPLRVFTHADLERDAKNAATAAMIVTAIGGVAAAYEANQNAYSTTNGYVRSNSGQAIVYSSRTYHPGLAAANTAIIGAATGATLISIDRALDEKLASLDGTILRTTTIDPNDVYGGEIVSDTLRLSGPTNVVVRVEYNGDLHEFRYLVSPN